MFVFDTAMLKYEGYSDKSDFFDDNDRKARASNSMTARLLRFYLGFLGYRS